MAQFLFYPLFLRLFVSLSLSRLSWSKKPPAPFVFFLTFSLPLDGTMGVVEKGKAHRRPVQKKIKTTAFSASFSKRVCVIVINKSSRFRIARGKVPSRRKKPHTHTRVTTPRKMSFAVSSFVGTRVVAKTNVRASSSSRRASSVQVFAERKLWWVRDVFFSYENRKRKRASARFRALVTSISIDLSNRANVIVVG